MLQFKNSTPFKGSIALFPDAKGVDTLFAMVKATFTLADDGSLAIADEQVPVTMEPKYNGDPATSSIAVPSDLSLMKPSTDVIVLGDAHAPRGRPTRVMDVTVAVGPVRHAVRVVGDRVWRGDGLSYRPTDAQPFVTMPLVWERAFGGRDRSAKGPREESRNPSGTGYRAKDGEEPIEGTRLPNLEDPRDPVTSWKKPATPACFAPVAAHWEPRRSYAGTYDEKWQSERAPYLPDDFDPRFLQIAPPALIAPRPLVGGEPVELSGFHPYSTIRFKLPDDRPRTVFRVNGSSEERPAMLDTVIIEPTAWRVQLLWRSAFACDKKALKVREVEATVDGRGVALGANGERRGGCGSGVR